MKKNIIAIIGATLAAMAFTSCDRVKVQIDPDGSQTPDVVKDARKREQRCQNMEWTPENQRTYPLDYCNEMLVELDKKDSQLEIVLHKARIAESQLGREVATLEQDMKKFGDFLGKAKSAYREAEASGTWPTTFNGRQVSQKELQKRIVEAGKKSKRAEARLPGVKGKLAVVSGKKELITQEQDKVSDLRQQFEDTKRDIELAIITGENLDLGTSLDSLNDSVVALQQSTAVGTDDTFFDVPPEEQFQADFDAIMAE